MSQHLIYQLRQKNSTSTNYKSKTKKLYFENNKNLIFISYTALYET